MNRGEVLTACFRDKQSQRSIRMEFVIIMILFDVMDYRSLYIVRYRSVRAQAAQSLGSVSCTTYCCCNMAAILNI